jgi:cell division septation protein DedD
MVELVELEEPSPRLVLVVVSTLVLVDDRSTIVTSVEEPTVLSTDRSSMLEEVLVSPLGEARSIVPPDAVPCGAGADTSELAVRAVESDPESVPVPAPSPDAHATPTNSPAAATAVTTPINFRNITTSSG